MAVVLLLAAALRVAVDWVRGPAVYQDSAIYLDLSEEAPFSFSPSRPNGYPVILRILFLAGRNADIVSAAQHVAGLAVGVLVYALLVRLGTRRWLATAVAAVIVFDAYGVALEQDVLTETFFTLALVASAYLMVATKRRPVELAASGALLAAATTMRVAGIFALLFWIAYVLWLRPGLRVAVLSVLAAIVPVLAYCGFHAAHDRGFALTAGDGWYLYGKVGPIVDCSGARIPEETRPLCRGPRGLKPEHYLYDRNSPAQVLFFGPSEPVDLEKGWTRHNSRLLRSFSMGIIRAHPVEYARVMFRDFYRYFGPNPPSVEMTLYGGPGAPLHFYERWFRLPWWLLTVATLTAVASLFLPRASRTREVAFLAGVGLVLVLGIAASAAFNPRYLVPVAPLLLAAGALGLEDFVATRRPPARTETTPSEEVGAG